MALYKRIAAASDEESAPARGLGRGRPLRCAAAGVLPAARPRAPPPPRARPRRKGAPAPRRRAGRLAGERSRSRSRQDRRGAPEGGSLRVRPRCLPAAEGVRRNSRRRRRRPGPRGAGSPRSRRKSRARALPAFASRGGRMRRRCPAALALVVLVRGSRGADRGGLREEGRPTRRRPAGNRRDGRREAVTLDEFMAWAKKATSEDPKNVSPRVLSSLLDQYLEEVLLARAVEAAEPPVPGRIPRRSAARSSPDRPGSKRFRTRTSERNTTPTPSATRGRPSSAPRSSSSGTRKAPTPP